MPDGENGQNYLLKSRQWQLCGVERKRQEIFPQLTILASLVRSDDRMG
jgi:hypothetical protein